CTFDNSNHVKRLLSSYVHPVICILAFVGNVLVILTIVLKKKWTKKENESDVFLLNLAISNLLFVVGLPFLIYNELFSWPMGQVACKLLQGSYSINLYSGMLLLAGISIVHYFIMGSSFENMISRSLNVCRIMCAVIWVFAILVSVPTFHFHHWYEPSSDKKIMLESEEDQPPQYVCALRFNDSKSSRMVKLAVPSFQITFGFLLPLLIIIVCNTLIIISLLRKKASTEARFGRKGLEKKAIKKMIWIMVVFVVCHMPYNLILLYDTTNMFQLMPCEVADGWQIALTITQSIAYLQCCLNPVVYSLAGGDFRNNIKTFYLPSKINKYICVTMTERPNQSCAVEQ
ncbi:C-C chemokine receptor type 6-like, partial [Fundulus diaphanus]